MRKFMLEKIYKGIAWCLAWGDKKEPQFDISILQKICQDESEVPSELLPIINKVQKLQEIGDYFPEKIQDLQEEYPELWNEKTLIGLVYGGATKIKQYVFEAAKLTDIRGASAILDKINLEDLPDFFEPNTKSRNWLDQERNFPQLSQALIPELIVYSTGGNILAFCPGAFVDDLANAIEKRYTEETLTANSCAVGSTFRLLEIRFGLLQENIENTPWLDWYRQNHTNSLVQSYFGLSEGKIEEKELRENFKNRKIFNELTTKLAALFNQRRNGNDFNNNRPSRKYPPMFETHPYLRRNEGDRRIAAMQTDLPNNPYYSEVLARKHLVGQITKRDGSQEWYKKGGFDWKPDKNNIDNWVDRFTDFIVKDPELAKQYNPEPQKLEPARSLRELGNVYKGFVAYIYADGNNMGGYIQNIKTPEEYQQFSLDIFDATEKSVYLALAKHLKPHKLENLTDPDNENRNDKWIHPFEILAIGGDDVMLIVPANKALEIAKTIGEEFENILANKNGYEPEKSTYDPKEVHRYLHEVPNQNKSSLSMSTGVLIAAEDTPVYYAESLTSQLLKSAKKRAKKLKEKGYLGGTIDFLGMKSVTMISSNIEEFRKEGLIKERGSKLKLYAAPYTLHEIGGLIESVKALKESKFPKSQIYQTRSFLEKGKNTAILNYLYFRSRLQRGEQQEILKENFENAWCAAKTNDGNLAPWMYDQEEKLYETIWREIVDIYEFIQIEEETAVESRLGRTKC